MSVKYTYSIQNDFPNHKVAIDRLTQEVQQSAITIALDFIGTSDGNCDLWFKDVLSDADQSVLSTVVFNHSGETLPQNVVQDVNIKTSAITLPSQEKAFPDFSGYPCFFDSIGGYAQPNTTSYFYTSYSKVVRIQGGGIWVGAEGTMGDYCRMELTYGQGGPIVGQFISKMLVHPGYETDWGLTMPDSQSIPVGIYLRLAYVNTSAIQVPVIGWFALRRTP